MKKIIAIISAILVISITAEARVSSTAYTKQLNSARSSIRSSVKGGHVTLNINGDELVINGRVKTSEDAFRVENIVKGYFSGLKIVNLLDIAHSEQVMLRVRVGEVSKDFANFGNYYKEDFDHLTRSGLITKLSDTNLVSLSGKGAEMLAGYEVPVQNGKDVEYKKVGTKVQFLPVVMSQSKIRLSIATENSSLEKNGKYPLIGSKSAKTTVDLSPGQSFMIAGMVGDEFANGKRKNTEVVIAVTPYLVNPVEAKDIRLPTDVYYKQNNMEVKFLENLNNNVAGTEITDAPEAPEGPTGLIVE